MDIGLDCITLNGNCIPFHIVECRALYYELNDSVLEDDGEVHLTMKALTKITESTLRETTAVKGIPNQKIRKFQQTETELPNQNDEEAEKVCNINSFLEHIYR